MLVDKITLQDIGLYDTNESIGLITHLNFCKTNGGKAQLDEYLLQPLSSIAAIEQRQEAIKFYIEKMEFLEAMKITNGTTLVIEKFFESDYKRIPTQISLPAAYWYQWLSAADYSLLRYSLEHLVLFYHQLQQWVLVFETNKQNPLLEQLVEKIKKYTQHPSLKNLPTVAQLNNPQTVLSLCHFFLYHYKIGRAHV